MEISIHALVKRATGYIFDKDGNVYDFNPRPRKEGDLRRISDTLCRIISIHALVKRATKYITKDNDKIFDFNPRPRKEGDKFCDPNMQTKFAFQSTPS